MGICSGSPSTLGGAMQAQGQRTAILSSLPLQILIYFENWFVLGFTAFNACAFVYKGSSYYYPKYMWPVEVATVLVFAVVQWARLFLASKSNKTEMLRPMIWSLPHAVQRDGLLVLHLRPALRAAGGRHHERHRHRLRRPRAAVPARRGVPLLHRDLHLGSRGEVS